MVEGFIQSSVQGVSTNNFLSGGSALCGPDLMTAVEMMLVQDYDDQMRSKAAEVKTATMVKKAYRELIQKLNNMLCRPSQNVDIEGDNQDAVACISLSQDEHNFLNQDINYVGNPSTLSVEPQSSEISGDNYIHAIANTYTNDEGELCGTSLDPGKNGTLFYKGKLYVTKEAIEMRIENYKAKLETVNEQSELLSLDLQTLTNQRKIAFETVSQIIRKQDEGMSTIIKNIS